MKLLTKHTDYAVRALLVLAQNKETFVSAREIANEQNIPYQFLRRILQELIKHKLVISKEGSEGGFKINQDPASIKVEEIIRIFQGNIQLSECMFRKKLCDNRSVCVLRKQIQRIEEIVSREFTKITIESLLKG
jgi:Rrf2 family cysteine metabolism transcriptional repressor